MMMRNRRWGKEEEHGEDICDGVTICCIVLHWLKLIAHGRLDTNHIQTTQVSITRVRRGEGLFPLTPTHGCLNYPHRSLAPCTSYVHPVCPTKSRGTTTSRCGGGQEFIFRGQMWPLDYRTGYCTRNTFTY